MARVLVDASRDALLVSGYVRRRPQSSPEAISWSLLCGDRRDTSSWTIHMDHLLKKFGFRVQCVDRGLRADRQALHI
jgi:hypothetical protein